MSHLTCMEHVYTDLIQSSRFAGRILSVVDQLWPDLGHTIASNFDNMFDIINRSNNLSRQVDNVLCFFDMRDTFVKLKLRFSYCNHFYGSVLWKLSHSNVERICSFWRMSVYVGHMHGLLNITHNAKYSWQSSAAKYLMGLFLFSTNGSSELHCLHKSVRPVSVKLFETVARMSVFFFVRLRLLIAMHIFRCARCWSSLRSAIVDKFTFCL